MKYPKLNPGEAPRVDLATEDLCLACCDCGSVHIFQFHHIKDDVWDIAMFPQKRKTGQLRRHNYGYLQQDGRLVDTKRKTSLTLKEMQSMILTGG